MQGHWNVPYALPLTNGIAAEPSPVSPTERDLTGLVETPKPNHLH
jgi:hypothetical protein